MLGILHEWDSEIHLTAFGKRLDDNQIRIERFGITISDKDKLQFYLKQMYASNHFDKKEMTEWENKIIAIKDNFNEAKLYFEGLVKDYKVFAQTATAPPASTTLKARIKQPMPTPEINCKCTLPEFHRQQLPKKSRPPTSKTALKHPLTQWQSKSRPCQTRSRNSPKKWTTKKTHQTAAAAGAVVAVDYLTEDDGES